MRIMFKTSGDMDRLSDVVVGTEPKRIIIYGMNYSPEIAGIGKYTGEIAEKLAETGAFVSVITTPPHYPGWKIQDGFNNWFSKSMENGVHVTRVPLFLRKKMSGVWRLIAPLTFAIASAPAIIWQIVRQRPDVVFCVEPTLLAAPAAVFAARFVGATTILHVQDLEIDAAFAVGHLRNSGFLKMIGYIFERFTLRRFDKIISISDRMAELLVAKGVSRDRVRIVRNWVDLSHIYPLSELSPYRAELGYSANDFIVLYSGNIGIKQGLNVLLRSAEKLIHCGSIRFVIAGEGPVKEDLQQRFGQLPNVRFLPFQPYDRLNEFLSLADVHVLPQESAAADLVLPSKLGGMLASGKLVLVTAEHETELANFVLGRALVIKPGDADELANTIYAIHSGAIDTTDLRSNSNCPELDKPLGLAKLFNCIFS